MEIIKRYIETDKFDYYVQHLKVLDVVFSVGITHKEIEVLAHFLNLDKEITEDDMFNTLARKKVKEKLGKMSAGGLSNHFNSLIGKGVMNKAEITNKLTITPFFIPEENKQRYQIEIVNNGN